MKGDKPTRIYWWQIIKAFKYNSYDGSLSRWEHFWWIIGWQLQKFPLSKSRRMSKEIKKLEKKLFISNRQDKQKEEKMKEKTHTFKQMIHCIIVTITGVPNNVPDRLLVYPLIRYITNKNISSVFVEFTMTYERLMHMIDKNDL